MALSDDTPEATNYPDPVDRASVETDLQLAGALEKQQLAAQVAKRRWPPREDGYCACGCDREVDPRRSALGYGLAIECAERQARK